LFKFDERFGMVSDAALLDRLEQVFAGGTFAETRTPLYIVATDFHTGEQVTLAEGSLLDALRASVAIPFIWSPWPVNGRLLIDGGLSDPLPVDVAIREGANIILAMGFENPQPRRVKSISRFAFHMSGIMSKNLFEANFAFHTLAHHAEIIPILPEFNREISLFDVDQIPAVIAAGERAAMEQIPYLRRLLAENWAGQYEPSRQMASQLR
jgi:NTE family protein